MRLQRIVASLNALGLVDPGRLSNSLCSMAQFELELLQRDLVIRIFRWKGTSNGKSGQGVDHRLSATMNAIKPVNAKATLNAVPGAPVKSGDPVSPLSRRAEALRHR